MLLQLSHDIESAASHSEPPQGDCFPLLTLIPWKIESVVGFDPHGQFVSSGSSVAFLFQPWVSGTLTAPCKLFGGSSGLCTFAISNTGTTLTVLSTAPDGNYTLTFHPDSGGGSKTGTITIGPGNDCDHHHHNDNNDR